MARSPYLATSLRHCTSACTDIVYVSEHGEPSYHISNEVSSGLFNYIWPPNVALMNMRTLLGTLAHISCCGNSGPNTSRMMSCGRSYLHVVLWLPRTCDCRQGVRDDGLLEFSRGNHGHLHSPDEAKQKTREPKKEKDSMPRVNGYLGGRSGIRGSGCPAAMGKLRIE